MTDTPRPHRATPEQWTQPVGPFDCDRDELCRRAAQLDDLYFMDRIVFDLAARVEALEAAQQPPRPIPLSERLPTEADCDAEGKCWLFGKVDGDWRRLDPHNSGVPKLSYCFSHWLPTHALPLPTGPSN